VPPESEIIDIACQAQQRVEASVPAPPAVSRTGSFTNLQQQLVPESTRHAIEMVLTSTAQSPSKLLQFGRNIVGQKLKSQLTGLSGGWHRSAAVVDGSVLYRPTDSPSPGGSFEQLSVTQPAETNGKSSSLTGSQTDVNNDMENTQQQSGVGPAAEVNLIDLSFEDSGDNLITFADNETVRSDDENLTHSGTVNPEKTLEHDLLVIDDLADNVSTTSQSDASAEPPAILLNDADVSSVRADRPLCRRQSLLKISHSESSLAMSLSTPPAPQAAASAQDLYAVHDFDMVDDDADYSSSSGGVSGFSRLLQGGKFAASLMVPRGSGMSAAAAATRRRQLEELAKNRFAKSQLRFKECRTRIILL